MARHDSRSWRWATGDAKVGGGIVVLILKVGGDVAPRPAPLAPLPGGVGVVISVRSDRRFWAGGAARRRGAGTARLERGPGSPGIRSPSTRRLLWHGRDRFAERFLSCSGRPRVASHVYCSQLSCFSSVWINTYRYVCTRTWNVIRGMRPGGCIGGGQSHAQPSGQAFLRQPIVASTAGPCVPCKTQDADL